MEKMAPDTNEYYKLPAFRSRSQSIIICCSWKEEISQIEKTDFHQPDLYGYFLTQAVKSVKTFTGNM
jgi:hypothetical protein